MGQIPKHPSHRIQSSSAVNRTGAVDDAAGGGSRPFTKASPLGPDAIKRSPAGNGNAGEVGYRRPPKAGQFRKGVSGNPKGREKGAKNFSTLLTEALSEHVTIIEDGSPRRISKLELMLKQLADQGAGGNLRALSIVLQRVDAAQNRATVEQTDVLDEADQEVAQALIRRIRNTPEGSEND